MFCVWVLGVRVTSAFCVWRFRVPIGPVLLAVEPALVLTEVGTGVRLVRLRFHKDSGTLDPGLLRNSLVEIHGQNDL